jgi:chromosome segregation ATPase
MTFAPAQGSTNGPEFCLQRKAFNRPDSFISPHEDAAYGPRTLAVRDHDRDTPELRRAANKIVRDTLFLSLHADPNSRNFAEDRVLEILHENISRPHAPFTPGMVDLIGNSLRTENNMLKAQIAERDEKVAYITQKFQALEKQMSAAQRHAEVTEVVRQGEDTKIQEMLRRMQAMSTANENETKQLKHQLDRMMAENHDLQAALKHSLNKASDAKLEKQFTILRDALSTEMARTRDAQNSVGDLIMSKDLEIQELKDYKANTEQRMEQLEKDDEQAKTQFWSLEIQNKSLKTQVEALQAQLAGTSELEALTNDIRQTVANERSLAEELVAEKERNLNLELEIKDLQHKIESMNASLRGIRDVQGISDDIRQLVGSAGDSAAELLEEKERNLALQLENGNLQQTIDLQRQQIKEQENFDRLLNGIDSLGHNVQDAQSLAAQLLRERERCSQLEAENVRLQREAEMLNLKLREYEEFDGMTTVCPRDTMSPRKRPPPIVLGDVLDV